MIDKWTHILSRIFFTAAFIISILYLVARILYICGWILPWLPISSGRFLELVAIALLFVITLLLRQIREELRKQSAK